MSCQSLFSAKKKKNSISHRYGFAQIVLRIASPVGVVFDAKQL